MSANNTRINQDLDPPSNVFSWQNPILHECASGWVKVFFGYFSYKKQGQNINWETRLFEIDGLVSCLISIEFFCLSKLDWIFLNYPTFSSRCHICHLFSENFVPLFLLYWFSWPFFDYLNLYHSTQGSICALCRPRIFLPASYLRSFNRTELLCLYTSTYDDTHDR